MTVRYSPRAAKALARLKTRYNDIEIFVEDTANPNMWIELIRSIVPNDVRIKSVNQLGGRKRVIDACKLDQRNDGRRKLYIIDGDFDHLLGLKKPKLRHLYRLRAYCVENLFIGEVNARYIGIASQPEWSEERVKKSFDYDKWHRNLLDQLRPLFILYAAANRLAPSIQTTAFSVSKLYAAGKHDVSICPQKTFQRKFSLLRSIRRTVSAELLRRTTEEIQNRARRLSMRECISGKDYLFPIFALRLRNKLAFKVNNEQMKVHLARSFRSDQEPWLAKRLLGLCS